MRSQEFPITLLLRYLHLKTTTYQEGNPYFSLYGSLDPDADITTQLEGESVSKRRKKKDVRDH